MTDPATAADVRERIRHIYETGEPAWYGMTVRGRDALPLIQGWGAASVLDIGGGYNVFARLCDERQIHGVGMDVACPVADMRADVLAIPMPDKSFDVTTAFHVLECLRETEIDDALAEMRRVGRRFVISLAYGPCSLGLHQTVKPRSWWKDRLRAHRGVQRAAQWNDYLVGEWRA